MCGLYLLDPHVTNTAVNREHITVYQTLSQPVWF